MGDGFGVDKRRCGQLPGGCAPQDEGVFPTCLRKLRQQKIFAFRSLANPL
jgi:hypothetical protein